MSELHSLFTDLLEIEFPFSLGKIDQEKVDNKIENVTLTIEIDKQYRPSNYHNIHSYYVKKWRHLSLFQYPCFIQARLPVFIDKRTNKTSVIDVPWARKGSGFTLLFEEEILDLLRLCNCVKTTATFFNLYPQRVQTVYDAYTKDAYEQREPQVAKKVGVDETSTKKGHDYITLFTDLETGQPLDIQDGKSAEAIENYAQELRVLGKNPQIVEEFSLDMSPAFISGVSTQFPDARKTFDRFHVVRLVGRYFKPLWKSKKIDKEELAFHVKQFDELWVQPNCQAAAAFFCYWLDRTEVLYKMASFRKSMFKHFQGIINFVESKVTNGMLEGMNSKIQFIKRAARGYRNTENFKRMILFAFNAL